MNEYKATYRFDHFSVSALAHMDSHDLNSVMTGLGIWSTPRFVLIDPQSRLVFQSDMESIETELVEAICKK